MEVSFFPLFQKVSVRESLPAILLFMSAVRFYFHLIFIKFTWLCNKGVSWRCILKTSSPFIPLKFEHDDSDGRYSGITKGWSAIKSTYVSIGK